MRDPRVLLACLALCCLAISCGSESGLGGKSRIEVANEKQILLISNGTEPEGLDPHLVTGVPENRILQSLFEGLVGINPENLDPTADAAAESWEILDEGTRYVFKLRPDGTWTNGDPVTAHDFVYSYHRMLNPKLGAKYSGMLYVLKNATPYNQNHLGYILCGLDPEFPIPWEQLKGIDFRGSEDSLPVNREALNAMPVEQLSALRSSLASFDWTEGDREIPKLTEEVKFKIIDRLIALRQANLPSELLSGVEFTEERGALLELNFKGLDSLSIDELTTLRSSLGRFDWSVEGNEIPELTDEIKREIIDRLIAHRKADMPDLWDRAQVGVTALDDYTLELKLASPTPYLLGMLNHYSWWPVHQGTIEKHGIDSDGNKLSPEEAMTKIDSLWTRPGNLVGNGGFVLREWKINSVIEVEKRDDYWDADKIKLNKIRFYPIDNTETEQRAFLTGYVHITNEIPLHRIEWNRKHLPESVRIDPWLGTYYYRVNTLKPPLTDPRVRRALSMSLNREEICDYLKAGQIPSYAFVPEGMPGYESTARIEESISEAKRLLAEAGFPDGEGFPELEILFNTLESHKQLAELLQQQWKKNLGIETVLTNKEWKVYLQASADGDYDIGRAGWIADYADPNSFLDMWMTGNGNNQTGFSNPEYDQLIKEANRQSDPKERFRLFQEAEEILMRESPVIPLFTYVTKTLVHPSVKGWERNLLNRNPYKSVYLTTDY